MRKNNYLSDGVFRFLLLLLLAAILPTACTDGSDETPFPEGKYPVEFTSQMYGMKVNTRTVTDNNTWAGGEAVTVQWGNYGTTKNYTAASNGNLTCTDPFYWTKDSENVTACYQQGESFTSMPTLFGVKLDQSTSEKYNQSDFILVCQTVRFADKEKKLKFKHLAAKVIVNLKGDDTMDVSNATVSFTGLTNNASFTASPSDDLSGINVKRTRLQAFAGRTIPYTCTSPASGFQKSVQALLLPHYADGASRFIKITLDNGKNYYYTPSPADCDLQSGKQYTYNITVRSDGTTVVPADVNLTESDEWTDEGTEDINSTPAGTLN